MIRVDPDVDDTISTVSKILDTVEEALDAAGVAKRKTSRVTAEIRQPVERLVDAFGRKCIVRGRRP